MNFRVRFKNPVFWATAIPAVVGCVYTIIGLVGIAPKISENELINALSAVVSALTVLGVLVDPTTKGVQDSERAMTYTEPK